MTFDPNIPNDNQSPGAFPPQNATNFTRLKTIINTDHVFNDGAQANDGIHRQVSMLTRATPTIPLANGAEAILFSKLDSLSQPQLWYSNGVTDVQITPFSTLVPQLVVGSAMLSSGGTSTAIAFADPGYAWAGTGFAYFQGLNSYNFYSLLRSGANTRTAILSQSGTVPSLSFSGNDLIITTPNATIRECVWSLIINRVL